MWALQKELSGTVVGEFQEQRMVSLDQEGLRSIGTYELDACYGSTSVMCAQYTNLF